MFAVIGAGGWSAHYLRSMGSERHISLRTLPVGVRLAPYPSKRGYGVRLAGMRRNWDSKCVVKIAPELTNRISARKSIQLPDMCNPMDNCPKVVV